MKSRREVVGFYMPYGKDDAPMRTVSQNADVLTVLSPTWFNVPDAEITLVDKREPELAEFAMQHEMQVWPLIANGSFTGDFFHKIIAEPERRDKLIKTIEDLMDSCPNCQGINLDFEGLLASDRGLYTDFLKRISDRLHAKDYLVTIDTPAKTVDDPQAAWPGAFDYIEINKYCDYVLIMTYDENIPGDPPGPVSSVGWTDDCMAYAASVIDKEKILMGIPFYGYDWAEDFTAKSFHYKEALETIKETGAEVQWDEETQCPWFTYQDTDGKKRTAWFEDRRSIAAKLKVAEKHDLGGVCIWSLGNEDPGIWDEIRKYQKG